MNVKEYYKTKDGKSLYQFCEMSSLNAYEFDLLKRLWRKKGDYKSDIQKSISLCDIYLHEYNNKSFNQNAQIHNMYDYIKSNWLLSDEIMKLTHLIINLRCDNYNTFKIHINKLLRELKQIHKKNTHTN